MGLRENNIEAAQEYAVLLDIAQNAHNPARPAALEKMSGIAPDETHRFE